MDENLEAVLQAIPEFAGRTVKATRLEGGLTNRNYRIDTDTQSYVVRVAGDNTALLGIDRWAEVECSRAAAEIGVGPEVVAHLPGHDVLVTRWLPGRTLGIPDLTDPGVLRRVVASLRRYHDTARPAGGAFSAEALVNKYRAVSRERHAVVPAALERATDQLSMVASWCATDDAPCPCHNDLLASNLLDDGRSVKIIDWEFGGVGDRLFDLGNLAANNAFDAEQERALLESYFGVVRPDEVRRLNVMRWLSDLREAWWGYLQTSISTLAFDYREYGMKHLARLNALDAHGRRQ